MTSRQAKLQEDTYFRVMRILQENPDLTQRELAEKLRVSVGGLHYCLRALMERGLVKMKNFANSKNKFGYVYVLTPGGMAEKATITHRFLQRKMDEYEELKAEIEVLKKECDTNLNLNFQSYRPVSKLSLINLIHFPPLGDERGSLVALEAQKTVPFDVKRVYYIFRTQPGVSRGFHAHRALQQVAVCVTGKCRLVLDDGTQREEVWLDSPTKGLLIGDFVWREMHDFSPDCVLLVLASEHYSEADYIRSYEDFKRSLSS